MKPGGVSVLVVDDEDRMRALLRIHLEREGFQVEEAADGSAALAALEQTAANLVLLDLMMPVMDGWAACRAIRERWDVPIIVLTARAEEYDRVLGLELGADDYVVKPFSPRELMARVRAVLRRVPGKRPSPAGGEQLTFPGLEIDRPRRSVTAGTRSVSLTPKEFDLLWYLAVNARRVLSREQLLEKVWGWSFMGESRTVDSHIKNLRLKLSDTEAAGYIHTVWGIGYKFEVV
ncbi:MAG: response regulator transcription factor [bacterium]|nr:response regulator transcription factor [bacterium]